MGLDLFDPTLICGWLIVQTVFALHYAHRYFGDDNLDGEVDGKIDSRPAAENLPRVHLHGGIRRLGPGVGLQHRRHPLRNLVTVHALIALFFNTMILALGINIFATILSS